MPTGNQNYTPSNLLGVGFPAAQADVISDSIQSNVTATGVLVSTAATSVADTVLLGSAATGNTGFQLRSGLGFKKRQIVINLGPGTATIYPPTGGVLNNVSAVTLASGVMGEFAVVNAAGTQYWKL